MERPRPSAYRITYDNPMTSELQFTSTSFVTFLSGSCLFFRVGTIASSPLLRYQRSSRSFSEVDLSSSQDRDKINKTFPLHIPYRFYLDSQLSLAAHWDEEFYRRICIQRCRVEHQAKTRWATEDSRLQSGGTNGRQRLDICR